VGSIAEGRSLVRDSFDVNLFQPGPHQRWEEAYGKYLTLRDR
jgi:hypothetical protein